MDSRENTGTYNPDAPDMVREARISRLNKREQEIYDMAREIEEQKKIRFAYDIGKKLNEILNLMAKECGGDYD